MADFSAEGNIRVDYVATMANIAAPDVVENRHHHPLSGWITPDGWSPAFAQNSVETTSLLSTFITSVPGTSGGPITITLKRDNTPANDTAWNLFKTGPSATWWPAKARAAARGRGPRATRSRSTGQGPHRSADRVRATRCGRSRCSGSRRRNPTWTPPHKPDGVG